MIGAGTVLWMIGSIRYLRAAMDFDASSDPVTIRGDLPRIGGL